MRLTPGEQMLIVHRVLTRVKNYGDGKQTWDEIKAEVDEALQQPLIRIATVRPGEEVSDLEQIVSGKVPRIKRWRSKLVAELDRKKV